MKEINILIVEDEKKEAEVLESIICNIEGTKGFWCSNGEDALKILEKVQIDLFMLDIDLPEMDGFTLAEQIREKSGYQLSPILFVTGSNKSALEAFLCSHNNDTF